MRAQSASDDRAPGDGARGEEADRAEGIVGWHSGRRFENVESAHEYVGLLLQAIQESAAEVDDDLRQMGAAAPARRREAFQLVAYKLGQLRFHVAASRRRLDDLRALRRMLEDGAGSAA
jgi:hypothetical protein